LSKMEIRERIVVIAGATGGLGRVVTRQFADLDCRLVLVSSDLEKLQALQGELNLPPDRALLYAADLSDPGGAQGVFEASLGKFGRVDILLNLVGGWMGGKTVPQVEPAEVSAMLQQHLWTTFYLTRVFVPHLLENGWGRIVIVSSPNAGNPSAKGAPYAIGKAAQEALVATIAAEVKGSGVTANVIRVQTIDVEHERERQPSSKNASWTTPEEIAAMIVYLCSDAARMINGARLPLYGSP